MSMSNLSFGKWQSTEWARHHSLTERHSLSNVNTQANSFCEKDRPCITLTSYTNQGPCLYSPCYLVDHSRLDTARGGGGGKALALPLRVIPTRAPVSIPHVTLLIIRDLIQPGGGGGGGMVEAGQGLLPD